MCNACTHLTTKHMQTNPFLAFLLPPLGLYQLPRSLRLAIWAGLLPPEVCALLALLSTCAAYCVQLLL